MSKMKWFFGLYPGDKVKINGTYFYISDFFPDINILFNVFYILKKNKLYNKIISQGFRNVFSIKDNLILVDSGSYIYYRYNLSIPSVDKIIQRYRLINPEYVVHNDIPVGFLNDKANKNRFLQKNLSNAKIFSRKTKNENYQKIGVAQGTTKEEYLEQIKELFHMDYEIIGIGGIARKSTIRIREYLDYIKSYVEKNKIKLHIFGVGRFDAIKNMPIYSFDNTSPVQDAHRDSNGLRTYYYHLNGKMEIIKLSLLDIEKGTIKVEDKCTCEMCKIFQEKIFQTGKAPRNRARSYHNALMYQKSVEYHLC